MNDEADVALVDSETERIRGNHRLETIGHESVLHVLAIGGRHLSVVQTDRHVAAALFIQPLGLTHRGDVDDSDSGTVAQKARESRILLTLIDRTTHFEAQVRAREASNRYNGIVHTELPRDVAAHFIRCCRRQGENRRTTETCDDGSEHKVVGTEVMPPLTHAVRFVDYE